MKRSLFFILIFCTGSSAFPSEWKFSQLNNHQGAFYLGLLTGFAGHELGHFAVAEVEDVKAEYDGITIVYPDEDLSDREQLRVSSAGFQAQWLISETALRYRSYHTLTEGGDNFNAGLVWAHLGITAAYLTILKNHKDGDIEGMSQATGISNNGLALMVAIPAALDAWRLMGSDVPDWVPIVSVGSKGLGIAAIWNF